MDHLALARLADRLEAGYREGEIASRDDEGFYDKYGELLRPTPKNLEDVDPEIFSWWADRYGVQAVRPYLAEMLAIMERRGQTGPDTPYRNILWLYADFLREGGDPSLADRLTREAEEEARRLAKEGAIKPEDMAGALEGRADFLGAMGDDEGALALYGEAFATLGHQLDEAPFILVSRLTRGRETTLLRLKRITPELERKLRDDVAEAEKYDARLRADPLMRLALAVDGAGRSAEARDLLRRYSVLAEIWPLADEEEERDWRAVWRMWGVSVMLRDLAKGRASSALMEEALQIAREGLGEDHPILKGI